MKRLLLLFFLVACSTAVIPVSKDARAPYQGSVAVFKSESEVKVPFTVIAAIHHYDWGKYQRLTVEDAIPILQEKAKAVCANGVIVDNCNPVYSGVLSRGIDVNARAILLEKK